MNRAVRFLQRRETRQLSERRTTWESPESLINHAKGDELPALYVVPSSLLPILRAARQSIVDCGRKHKDKGLSSYLLNKTEKVPLVDGTWTERKHGFVHSGQLVRSIRDLLNNAVRKKLRQIYIVGIGDDLFNELWQRAEPQSEKAVSPEATERVSEQLEPSSSLADRLRRNIPEQIVRAYGEKVAQRYIGESKEIDLVRVLILLAAAVDDPVLILGENGTGKEIVARSIHDYSARHGRPFLGVNCAAISPALLELELFGSRAAGGGLIFKRGLFELADKGTLFLDEVADMQLDHQAKVLRAIETGMIRPIGSEKEVKVDVRLIASTNRELSQMIEAGQFRIDLFHRLDQFPIHTPSLNSHPEDIPRLAQLLWRDVTGNERSSLPEDVLKRLASLRWPGNVRQLKSVIRRMKSWFGTAGLTADDLDSLLRYEGHYAQPAASSGKPAENVRYIEQLLHLRRVEDVIRTCEIGIQPIVHDRKMEKKRVDIAHALMHQRLDELERLTRKPRLFNDEATFSKVHRLTGRLVYFLSLLKESRKQAEKYWDNGLEREFENVRGAVSHQIELLRKEI